MVSACLRLELATSLSSPLSAHESRKSTVATRLPFFCPDSSEQCLLSPAHDHCDEGVLEQMICTVIPAMGMSFGSISTRGAFEVEITTAG